MIQVYQQLLTQNDCYRAGRTIVPQGVMVHSTGANNPNLSRYVPGSDAIGRNTGGNHWNQPGTGACVHAFVGKLANGEVGIVQTLPWTMRGWHCGKGNLGSANDTHISFEICEDGLRDADYFAAVYQAAVELTADLCRQFSLDPEKDGVVICHSEGHARGVASNHGDVMHWFPQFGKSMDTFRADVVRAMKGEDEMTQEQFDAMLENYLARKAGEKADQPWEQTAVDKAQAAGFSDGQRPRAMATRVEVMAMVAAAIGK